MIFSWQNPPYDFNGPEPLGSYYVLHRLYNQNHAGSQEDTLISEDREENKKGLSL